MCGPSRQQKDLAAQQSELSKTQKVFYDTMTADFKNVFGDSANIFKSLTDALSPIVSAGPNQYGFSPAEDAAKRGEVIDTAGQTAQDAQIALGAQESARGGEAFMPSGAKEQLSQQANLVADQSKAQGLRDVTTQGYDTGRQNFFASEAGLAGAPEVFNPATSFSGATTSGGNAAISGTGQAFDTASKIRQMQLAWLKPVLGAVGSVFGPAGAAIGGKIGGSIAGSGAERSKDV